jgi:hypothetical protein
VKIYWKRTHAFIAVVWFGSNLFPPDIMTSYLPISQTREYWMIYRGPGFLAVLWFGSTPSPFPPLSHQYSLSYSVFLWVAGRASLQERCGEGVGVEPNDLEKAWPSINHLILSVFVSMETVYQRVFNIL